MARPKDSDLNFYLKITIFFNVRPSHWWSISLLLPSTSCFTFSCFPLLIPPSSSPSCLPSPAPHLRNPFLCFTFSCSLLLFSPPASPLLNSHLLLLPFSCSPSPRPPPPSSPPWPPYCPVTRRGTLGPAFKPPLGSLQPLRNGNNSGSIHPYRSASWIYLLIWTNNFQNILIL